MNEEERKKIINAIEGKGVKLPCPQCEGLRFELIGQTDLPLTDANGSKNFMIPSVLFACSNCGLVMLHVLEKLT